MTALASWALVALLILASTTAGLALAALHSNSQLRRTRADRELMAQWEAIRERVEREEAKKWAERQGTE